MFQQFTPLAARLIVEEDDLAPLPPPPEDDAELDNNEDPLFSAEGAWEASWETEYRRYELSQALVDEDEDTELGAWTVGSDKLVLFGRGVDDREPRSITMSLGGQRMNLRLACCGEASTILVEGHDVWEWGKHVSAGFIPRHPTRLQVLCGRHITSVACGANHSISLSAQDEVWVWGEGGLGQLGLGDWQGCSSPTPLTALSGKNIIGIGCGHSHSLAFAGGGGTKGNTLWTWGNNQDGQLGHSGNRVKGWRRRCNEPTEVGVLSGSGVLAVCGGAKHSLALLACDEVWAWGTNDHGQLGLSNINDWPWCASVGPTRRSFLPRCVEDLSGLGIIQISCGSLHSAALSNSGALFGWGRLGKVDIVHSPETIIQPVSATRPLPSPLVRSDTAGDDLQVNACTTEAGDAIIMMSSSSVDIFASTRSGRLLMLKGRPLPIVEAASPPPPQVLVPLPPPPLPPPPPGIRPALSSDELARTAMAYRAVSEEGRAAEQPEDPEPESDDEVEEEALLMDDCVPMDYASLERSAILFQEQNPESSYDDWLLELDELDSEDAVKVWEDTCSASQPKITPMHAHEWSQVDLGKGRGLVLSSDGCGAAHTVCFSGVCPGRTRSSLAEDLGALLTTCGKEGQSEDVVLIQGRQQDDQNIEFHWLGDVDFSADITVHRALINMRLPGLSAFLPLENNTKKKNSKVILDDIAHSVLVCLIGWAYTSKFPIREVIAEFDSDDRACRWLLEVVATSKRFRVPRVEWLCTFELYHRLTFPKCQYGEGEGEEWAALVVDILLLADSLDMTHLKQVILSLIAAQFKAIVSDHALFVVSRLNTSASSSNDLLATLLRLGDSHSTTSPYTLAHCPPDALDVSMLHLFRRTLDFLEEQGEDVVCETVSGGGGGEVKGSLQLGETLPDVIITFSSGLKFSAHSAVLAARSRFFEKALHYHTLSADDSVYRLSIVEDELINPPAPEPAAFTTFLRFLYTGSTRPVEPTHALYLLQVLDYFDLRSALEADKLSRACHAAIIKKVDDASALPLLKSAHRLGLPRIRELAFKHVLAHASGCLSDSTNGESLETLCTEMPELASALILALVEERDNARSAVSRPLSRDIDDESD